MNKFFAGNKWKRVLAGVGAGVALTGGAAALTMGTLMAEEFQIHPPKFQWAHNGPLDQLDMKRSVNLN